MPGRLKKTLIILGGLFLLVGIVFLSGPRVDTRFLIEHARLPEDPAQLEEYLETSEAQFSDITPGAEKKIVWAHSDKRQTEYAIVSLHGYSATRQEIMPLPKYLAEALQANIYYARYTGHGRSGEAMLVGSVDAWLNDTMEAYDIGKKLGQKVIILGVSTGGTAATWLATYEQPAASVLISPNYGTANSQAYMLGWPWGGLLAELIIGKEREWEPHNAEQAKYWTWKYPSRALLPMMGMVQTAQDLHFGRIRSPILVIYSPEDQVVDATLTQKYFAEMGSKHKEIMAYTEAKDPSQHVLAGDILSPGSAEVLQAPILGFLRDADVL